MRATASIDPPAGCGTMTRTDLAGQDSAAEAGVVASAMHTTRLAGPLCSDPKALRRKRFKRSTVSSTNISSAMRANRRCSFGMEPLGGTPEDLAGFMASELTKWRPVAEKMTPE